jgi:histidine triad (HIT) family protein
MRASVRCEMSDDFYCDRVLNGLEPVDVVHEDDTVLAFHHTRPFFADAHIVVVPKRHVASLVDPAANDVLPQLLAVLQTIAADVLDAVGAARVLTNLGRYQDSKHLHWHVYAGAELGGTTARPSTGRERRVGRPS